MAPQQDTRVRVLLIDDNLVTRTSVAQLLEKFPIQVLESPNGRDALDRLKMFPDIDFVISDLHMPILNGEALLERLADRKLPVVLYSGALGADSYEHTGNPNIVAVLEKPLDIYKLLGLIRQSVPAHPAVHSKLWPTPHSETFELE